MIIPLYNAAAYLAATLQSIADQSFTDFEAIMVDDGSTDNTLDIALAFCVKDPRFKLIEQPHQNAGVARNTGMDHACGDYLLFFDGDDIMEPDMLARMIERADETNADAVICKTTWFADGGPLQVDETWDPRRVELDGVYAGTALPDTPFFTTIGWPWDKIFKASFVAEQGLRYQSLASTNDAFFVFVGLALAERIAFVDARLVRHRMNNRDSISNSRSKMPHDAALAIEAIGERLKFSEALWNRFEQPFKMWGLNHLRWNYRTLEGEPRQEAFNDYLRFFRLFENDRTTPFHDREEAWAEEVFNAPLSDEETKMALLDARMDKQYSHERMENLERDLNESHAELRYKNEQLQHQNEQIDSLQRRVKELEESTSYKVGKAITYIPRSIKNTISFDD